MVISVFSKCSLPEACHFIANKTMVRGGERERERDYPLLSSHVSFCSPLSQVNAVVSYEGGKRTFQKTWKLEGVRLPCPSIHVHHVIRCYGNTCR